MKPTFKVTRLEQLEVEGDSVVEGIGKLARPGTQ